MIRELATTRSTDEVLRILIPEVMRDITALTCQSVLYGCFVISAGTTLYHLLKPRRAQRRATWMVAVSVLMFIVSTFHWASNFAVLFRRFRIVFLDADGTIISRIARANEATIALIYANDILFVVLYLIGDAALAWRVYILERRTLPPALALAAFWIASFGTGLAFVGCSARERFPVSYAPQCSRLQTASWLASLLFNGLTVGFLVRLAVSHRKLSRNLGVKSTLGSRALDVLAIASLVYVLLGIPRLAQFSNETLNPLPTSLSYANEVIGSMLLQLVGLYPTCVSAFLFHTSIVGQTLSETAARDLEISGETLVGNRASDESGPLSIQSANSRGKHFREG